MTVCRISVVFFSPHTRMTGKLLPSVGIGDRYNSSIRSTLSWEQHENVGHGQVSMICSKVSFHHSGSCVSGH